VPDLAKGSLTEQPQVFVVLGSVQRSHCQRPPLVDRKSRAVFIAARAQCLLADPVLVRGRAIAQDPQVAVRDTRGTLSRNEVASRGKPFAIRHHAHA
jgi:hypothetical protein